MLYVFCTILDYTDACEYENIVSNTVHHIIAIYKKGLSYSMFSDIMRQKRPTKYILVATEPSLQPADLI